MQNRRVVRKKRKRRKSSNVNTLAPIRKRRKTSAVKLDNSKRPKDLLNEKSRYGKKRQFQFTDNWIWGKFYPNMNNPNLSLNHWSLRGKTETTSKYSVLDIKPPSMTYSDEEYNYIENLLDTNSRTKYEVTNQRKETTPKSNPQTSLSKSSLEKPKKSQTNINSRLSKKLKLGVKKSKKSMNKKSSTKTKTIQKKQKTTKKKNSKKETILPPPPIPSDKKKKTNQPIRKPNEKRMRKPISSSSTLNRTLPFKTSELMNKITDGKNHLYTFSNTQLDSERLFSLKNFLKPQNNVQTPNNSNSNNNQITSSVNLNIQQKKLIPTQNKSNIIPPPSISSNKLTFPLSNKNKNNNNSILNTPLLITDRIQTSSTKQKQKSFVLSKQNFQRRKKVSQGLNPPFEKWTKEETDELFDLCEKYNLQFHVIQDRLSFHKSLESIKERYLTLSQILIFVRSKGKLDEVIEHPYIMNSYDSSYERKRKKKLAIYYKTPDPVVSKQKVLQKELVGIQSKLKVKRNEIRDKRKKVNKERDEEQEYYLQFAIQERNKRLQSEHERYVNALRKIPDGVKISKKRIDEREQHLKEVTGSSQTGLPNLEIPKEQSLIIRSPKSVTTPKTPVLVRRYSLSPTQVFQNNNLSPSPVIFQQDTPIFQPPPINPSQMSEINKNNNPNLIIEPPQNLVLPASISNSTTSTPQKSKIPPPPIIISHNPSRKKGRRKRINSPDQPDSIEGIRATKFDKSIVNKLVGEDETPRVFVRSQLMKESIYGSPYTQNIIEYLEEKNCDVSDIGVYSSRIHEEFSGLKDKIGVLCEKKKESRKRRGFIKDED